MWQRTLFVLVILAGCAKQPQTDLQYIKQARSLAAEWALVNEESEAGKLTPTYVHSMHQWLRDGIETASSSLSEPDSRYGREIQTLLTEPEDAAPEELRAHSQALKQIEDGLESA